MIVERFKPGCIDEVYSRYHQTGRKLPEGVFYLNSWVNKNEHICFQLMETNFPERLETWINEWKDVTEFTVYPID